MSKCGDVNNADGSDGCRGAVDSFADGVFREYFRLGGITIDG